MSPSMLTELVWELGLCHINWKRGKRIITLHFLHKSLLAQWILLKGAIYSGDWAMKMGDGRWCVPKRRCHNKWTSSAWDFSEGHSPTLQNTFFRTNLSRKMQSRWRSAPGKLQQCAWACPSFPGIADERFMLTQLTSLRVTSVLSPPLNLHKNHCSWGLLQCHTWNTPAALLSMLWVFVNIGNEDQVKPGGLYVLYEPAGQDWHCRVTQVRLWPLAWKHKAEFSPHFAPPESSLVPYMAALYYDPFK